MGRKKKTKEEKIDFIVTIPKSWDEITLEKYQQIEACYDEEKNADITAILAVLTDKPKEEIDQLPFGVAEKIVEHATFLKEAPDIEPNNMIEIDGEKYAINILEQMKVKEYVDADTIIKQKPVDYAALLAIICRKANEIYNDDFIANILNDRIELFKQQPITKILPLSAFFLTYAMSYQSYFQAFSEVQEELNRTQKQLQNSQKIGAFKRYYLTWQTKKLAKSLSLNSHI